MAEVCVSLSCNEYFKTLCSPYRVHTRFLTSLVPLQVKNKKYHQYIYQWLILIYPTHKMYQHYMRHVMHVAVIVE